MKPRLSPGDRVRMNSYGLYVTFGAVDSLRHFLDKPMEVISVNDEPLRTTRVPEFLVEVSDPDVNSFLVTDLCFDRINH